MGSNPGWALTWLRELDTMLFVVEISIHEPSAGSPSAPWDHPTEQDLMHPYYIFVRLIFSTTSMNGILGQPGQSI